LGGSALALSQTLDEATRNLTRTLREQHVLLLLDNFERMNRRRAGRRGTRDDRISPFLIRAIQIEGEKHV
jgi:hypothetical protein